jgi:uncharacterized protein (TIGR01777 family)
MRGPILIAGGTGLLGRALTQRLLLEGREVIVLSRSVAHASGPTGFPPGCRWAVWDGRTADGWGDLANGAAAIVNLAGESIAAGRWSRARKASIVRSRQQATAAILAAIGQASRRPEALIQASAIGYYGDRAEELLTESAAPGEGFLATTTRDWEAASEGCARFGVRRVVVRTGIVLAREGGALPKMLLPFRLGAGAILGSGRQWMSWIHLADEVAALAFLIEESGAQGVFNLTAPEPQTQAGFSRSLAAALRRPLLARAPAWVLRAAMGEMSELVLASQRVVPQRLIDLGFRFRFPRLQAALADLCRGQAPAGA